MSSGHQLWIARGHFCLRNVRPVKKRCTGTAMGAEGNFAAEAARQPAQKLERTKEAVHEDR